MSSFCDIRIDDSQLTSAMSTLSGKEIRQVYRNSMKKAVRPLAKATEQRYSVLLSREKLNTGKDKKSQNIVKLVSRTRNGIIVVKVHIMQDYKAKWFEMGTNKRYTKGHRNVGYYKLRPDSKRRYVRRTGKPGYRGYIRPRWIFTTEQQKQEKSIVANMDRYLNEGITTLISKKIKS